MRVLHVISGIDPENGGPSMALRGLAHAQVRLGMEVRIVATYQRSDAPAVAEQWRERGLDLDLIGPARGPLSRHPDIRPALQRRLPSANVVHVHALWEEIQHQAMTMARRMDVPYVVRPCGMLAPWSLNRSRWKKRLYMRWRLRRHLDRASLTHYTSEIERDEASRLRIPAPTVVEPNGIDLNEFEHLPPPGTFRDRHPQLARRPIVLLLGRIHPVKGFDLLIPAFAQGAPADAQLVLAGPDTVGYQREVEDMVRRHGLEERVLFTGMLNAIDRIAALRDAELFVLPSYHENFANVVVESLAAGTPVVISDRVNIHPLITANRLGEVVPRDVDALAGALQRWLTDSHLRTTTAERCRAYALATFDWNRIAERWGEHYERLKQRCSPHHSGLGVPPERIP